MIWSDVRTFEGVTGEMEVSGIRVAPYAPIAVQGLYEIDLPDESL